ncbi:MAG: type IV toxin-antitoxin system AbiEi family antitoxin domain-containing protein, partial [Deltaproteobacteria bacterium]|nr:type IV toxin-antitoxin system AbiEi family antitoxin domain-containing protein [Deltaproteobacteria bacterium]
RARELDELGIPRVYLSRLVRRGQLERINRGLYQLADSDITAHFTLVQAAKRIPGCVTCLLSALSFHNFTTQLPHQVWIAIERGKWEAGLRDLPLRIFEFSGKSFHEGVETHNIQGVVVKVYSPAKTVADCFKYRNKIGLDVALEALRECQRERKSTIDELWHYANVCRVTNIMRPYMEAMA